MTTLDGPPPYNNATTQHGSEGLLFDYTSGVCPQRTKTPTSLKPRSSNRRHKVFVVIFFYKVPPVRKRNVDFGVVTIRCV